ncbi:MAG TPA: response regulator [Methylomirabilota bacterium]|nr:response regulator [Methylomirabilota bacterium]
MASAVTPSARILIIDDDAGMCQALEDVLRLRGHAVQAVRRGKAGLERLQTNPVDAAIVDIRLPDISGLALLDAIKTASPDTEVIFITGHASLASALQAINGSAFAYLVKPFELEHFLATVDKALERRRLGRALRESEERYRLITENTTDAMFLFDLDGHVLFSNRRAEELTGRRREELRGRAIWSILSPPGPEPGDTTGLEVAGAFETPLLSTGGPVVWVEATFSRVVKDGRVVGHLAVARDITAQKRGEAELERQRDALMQAEKVAAMGALLAGVAHEINNPLAVIMAETELMQFETEDKALARRLDRVATAAERCARTVKGFLALARQRPPERQAVRLNHVVREALELLNYALRVDDVVVTLDLGHQLPVLWADPHQLHQVLVNLIANAHQAMRDAPLPRQLRLTTSFDPEAGRVSVAVADTGPGIPPAVQARIFDPFFTTRPPGQGTGLGLAICRAIVQAHDGSLLLQSQPGHGAVFRVDLPVVAPPAALSADGVEPVPRPAHRWAILVVDDEPEITDTLADMLSRDGHHVETAPNGAIALDKLSRRRYDLILSDIKMPELDGPGLYREIARRHPGLERRMVFLTGDVFSPVTQGFLQRTKVAFVTKPFAGEELQRILHQILGPSPSGG